MGEGLRKGWRGPVCPEWKQRKGGAAATSRCLFPERPVRKGRMGMLEGAQERLSWQVEEQRGQPQPGC